MSIQTKQARKIFDGKKLWEFRKAIPKNIEGGFDPARIVVYSAGVDRAIIGEFTVGRVLATSLGKLMEETGYAGDPEAINWFSRYYKGQRFCRAIEVTAPILYSTPLTLGVIRDYMPTFRPPQNFIYVDRYPEIEVALKEGSAIPN